MRQIVVQNCARCGDDHAVSAHEFIRPVQLPGLQTITHWASCPKLGEPVLVSFGEADDEKETRDFL